MTRNRFTVQNIDVTKSRKRATGSLRWALIFPTAAPVNPEEDVRFIPCDEQCRVEIAARIERIFDTLGQILS
jgi:hypothetical protein